MAIEELRSQTAALSADEKKAFLADETAKLPKDAQKDIAERISKDVWPQDSLHRMFTILGSLVLALGAAGLAIVAANSDATEIGTALVAVSTAIVGGIFGFAQGSK
ncbi:MAG: hypothetical protein WD646_15975 [Actinomycetota bacterium]